MEYIKRQGASVNGVLLGAKVDEVALCHHNNSL
jgi:hypothetical protein